MTSCCCFAIVKQSEAGIMESVGGQFSDVVPPGCNCFNPCSEKFAGTQSLRTQLIRCDIPAVTKDRTTLHIRVTVVYRAIPSHVHRSYYSMAGAADQIRSFVVANLRGFVPEKTLDEVFLERDHIASNIRKTLASTLQGYGFEIVDTLIEDVNIQGDVRRAIDQQTFQRYNREVQRIVGEINKIKQVKHAEGQSEAQRLSGVGTANERAAIATAFRQGMEGFSDDGEVSQSELTALVLMTQYFDMINDISKDGKVRPVTYYMPLKQGKLDRDELRQRLKTSLQQSTFDRRTIDNSDL